MNDSFRASIETLFRLAVVIGFLIFIFQLFLIAFIDIPWEPELRAQVVMFGLVPPAVAASAFYIFEQRVYAQGPGKEKLLLYLLIISSLSVPPLWLMFRNQLLSVDIIQTWNEPLVSVLAIGSLTVLFSILNPSESRKPGKVRYFHDVFWNACRPDLPVYGYVNEHDIRIDRKQEYLSQVGVKTFQASFIGLSEEASAAAEIASECLAHRAIKTQSIDILDVGCAEGHFTASFLDGLQSAGVSVERVDGLDALNVSTEYQQALTAKANVTFHHCKWQEFDVSAGPYDCIILSHSLYEAFDNEMQDGGQLVQRIARKFSPALKEGGFFLVGAASRHSRAYRLKSYLLNVIYGITPRDLDAEILLEAFNDRVGPWELEINIPREVNTYFRVPADDEQRLQFLRYFIRSPLRGGAADIALAKLEMFLEPAQSFPLEDRNRLNHLQGGFADGMLLPHRTKFFIVGCSRLGQK